MSAPLTLDIHQSLMRLTDALDPLDAADQARVLDDLARMKPNAPTVYGLACLRAGADAEEAADLVRLFKSVPMPVLAEVLERRAAELCDAFGLCRTCYGVGCPECRDLSADARDRDFAEQWQRYAA